MCIKDIYLDRYPDGRELEYQRTTICENGVSGRPCAAFHINRHRHRNITYDELSTQYIMNHPTLPTPRNSMSPGRPSETTSTEGSRGKNKRRTSGLWTRGAANLFGFDRPSSSERKHKQRREKIVYVDEVPRSPQARPAMPSPGHLYPPSPRSPYVSPAVPSPPARNDYSSSPQAQPNLPSAGRGRPLVVDERNRQRSRPERSQSIDVTREETSSRRTASPVRTPQIVVIPDGSGRARIDSRERRRDRNMDDYIREERRRQREIHRNNQEIRDRPAVPLDTPPRSSRRQSAFVRFEDDEHVYDSRPSPREPVYTSREVEMDVGADAAQARRRRVHSTIGQSIRFQEAVAGTGGIGYEAQAYGGGEGTGNPDAMERRAALMRQWDEETLRVRREADIAVMERLRERQRRGLERRNTVALDDVGRRGRRDRERERVVYYEDPRFW